MLRRELSTAAIISLDDIKRQIISGKAHELPTMIAVQVLYKYIVLKGSLGILKVANEINGGLAE